MIAKDELAQMIDHTNLHAYASDEDMKKLCSEALQYHFKMVAVNSVQTALCARYLKDTGVHTGAAIGFPLGQQTINVKAYETEDAISHGADEIDYVINISALKNKNYAYVEDEMKTIVSICHNHNVIVKAIFENCYLTKDEIIKMSQIAKKVKPDFIKTSTGFGTGGAEVEDVKLMKSVVLNDVKVKAAGGIRTLEKALSMIDAGAERIGTSSGIAIMKELEEYYRK